MLELTFNHDGRTYDLGTGYGHIAIGVEGPRPNPRGANEPAWDRPRAAALPGERGWFPDLFRQDPDDYRIELIERSDD